MEERYIGIMGPCYGRKRVFYRYIVPDGDTLGPGCYTILLFYAPFRELCSGVPSKPETNGPHVSKAGDN